MENVMGLGTSTPEQFFFGADLRLEGRAIRLLSEQECMRRADSGVNVGYAIIYECVNHLGRILQELSVCAHLNLTSGFSLSSTVRS
jgi:hypothetical protein